MESKESLLGNSLFSFLFGGQVASGYELRSYRCNMMVTLIGSILILRKLRNKCCPNFKMNWSKLPFRSMIANSQVEVEEEQGVDKDGDEESEVTETTNLTTQTAPIVEVTRECWCITSQPVSSALIEDTIVAPY